MGILVYWIGGSIISLAMGLLAAGLAGAAVVSYFRPRETAGIVAFTIAMCIVVGLGIAVVVMWWFLREYRRQGGGEIRLWQDRIERVVGKKVESLPFAEIGEFDHIEGTRPDQERIILRGDDGRTMGIGAPWPITEIERGLQEHAVPVVVGKFRAALDRGETLAFREPFGRALLAAVGGIVSLLAGGFLVVALSSALITGKPVNPHLVLTGILFLLGGVSSLAWFVRTRGIGMALTKTGLRRPRDSFGPETPWSDVKKMTEDSIGVRLEGDALERPYRLSRRAPNYLVLVLLIPELAPLDEA